MKDGDEAEDDDDDDDVHGDDADDGEEQDDDEEVLPEEEDQPHLLPLASLLRRLAVLQQNRYSNINTKIMFADLGDWIGLLEAVEPGALHEERAHSKKSLQVLCGKSHMILSLISDMMRFYLTTRSPGFS